MPCASRDPDDRGRTASRSARSSDAPFDRRGVAIPVARVAQGPIGSLGACESQGSRSFGSSRDPCRAGVPAPTGAVPRGRGISGPPQRGSGSTRRDSGPTRRDSSPTRRRIWVRGGGRRGGGSAPAAGCQTVRALAMMACASSIGMAKPMPCALVAAALLMPITRPAASRSGPPLLPSLIAASV